MFGYVNTKERTEYEIFPPLQKDPENLPKVLNMPFMGSEGAFVKRTGAHMTLSEFQNHRLKYLTAEQRAVIIKTKEHNHAHTSVGAGRKYAERLRGSPRRQHRPGKAA